MSEYAWLTCASASCAAQVRIPSAWMRQVRAGDAAVAIKLLGYFGWEPVTPSDHTAYHCDRCRI